MFATDDGSGMDRLVLLSRPEGGWGLMMNTCDKINNTHTQGTVWHAPLSGRQPFRKRRLPLWMSGTESPTGTCSVFYFIWEVFWAKAVRVLATTKSLHMLDGLTPNFWTFGKDKILLPFFSFCWGFFLRIMTFWGQTHISRHPSACLRSPRSTAERRMGSFLPLAIQLYNSSPFAGGEGGDTWVWKIRYSVTHF